MKKTLKVVALLIVVFMLSACTIWIGGTRIKINEKTGEYDDKETDKEHDFAVSTEDDETPVDFSGNEIPEDDDGSSSSSNNPTPDPTPDPDPTPQPGPGPSPDPDPTPSGNELTEAEIANLVSTAVSYAGYTRNDFKPVASKYGYSIGDSTSWCAIFVSSMIKASGTDKLKKYVSKSVSDFLENMLADGRFYHSDYWYNKSGNFKDPKGGPQVGDIVFFTASACVDDYYKGDGKLPSKSKCYRHIGIVIKVANNRITYVHGNTGSCKKPKIGNGVCATSVEKIKDNKYIVGYGR